MASTDQGADTQHELPLVLRPADIAARQWHPLADSPGVDYTELWRSDDFTHSLVRYQPGARTSGPPHLAAYHHLWIVSGSASVAGQHVTAGSYLLIPPGTAHPVGDVGPDGCVMLRVHRPMPPRAHPVGRSEA